MFKASTLLLFAYYIYRLIKPLNIDTYKTVLRKICIEKTSLSDLSENEKLQSVQFLLFFTALIVQQTFEFIYLLFALNYDTYKIPTIAMVIWFVIMLAKPKPKDDIDALFLKMGDPKFKLKSKIIAIIDILYFGYMLYLIII